MFIVEKLEKKIIQLSDSSVHFEFACFALLQITFI